MTRRKGEIVALGSVRLGDKFIYRTDDLQGPLHHGRKPFWEGQVLTVVGFKPRYVNKVELSDGNGRGLLMPLAEVERALSLKSLQVPTEAFPQEQLK